MILQYSHFTKSLFCNFTEITCCYCAWYVIPQVFVTASHHDAIMIWVTWLPKTPKCSKQRLTIRICKFSVIFLYCINPQTCKKWYLVQTSSWIVLDTYLIEINIYLVYFSLWVTKFNKVSKDILSFLWILIS